MKNLKKTLDIKKIVAVTLATFVVFFAVAQFASAALPNADQFCSGGRVQGLNCNNYTLNGLIVKVINWVLGITLAVDVLFIIIGGFLYITSAGNEDRAKKGKTTVINAIIGLVIIILAYVIAQVVSNFFETESVSL